MGKIITTDTRTEIQAVIIVILTILSGIGLSLSLNRVKSASMRKFSDISIQALYIILSEKVLRHNELFADD